MSKFRWIAPVLACLILAPACGKKGGILPPLTLVPKKAEALKAIQRGGSIVLDWTNPESYVDGRPLQGISEIEIWLEEKPDKPAAPAVPPAGGDISERGRRVALLKGEENVKPPAAKAPANPPAKTPAVKPAARKPFPPHMTHIYKLDPKGWSDRTFMFAVRVREMKRNRPSDFTDNVSLKAQALSGPPPIVRTEVFQDRIDIRWDLPAANFDGSAPPRLVGFNIYKIDAGGGQVRLNTALVADKSFADRDFQFDRPYRYLVRATISAAEPFVESDDSPVVEIVPKDVFPPSVPGGLSALAGPDFITIIWDAGPEKDIAGYHVRRRAEGQSEFVRLTTAPILETTYTDKSVEKGKKVEYAISAVDIYKNESARSASVTETIRIPIP
jgi:hypothetical protein